jgi:hypothetical protein
MKSFQAVTQALKDEKFTDELSNESKRIVEWAKTET